MPGPASVLSFWQSKAANLGSIYHQLRAPHVAKIAMILEVSKSSYSQAFTRITEEAKQGLWNCRC
jgi:dynein heavy chain